MESDVVEVKETPISVLSTSRPISSEMWPDHCPGPLGLKCDCFVQYCTLLVIIMMCLLLGGVGIACLIGVQDLCLLSDKPIWGVVWIVVALMLLTIYSLLFLFLGECGRKRLGLKMKRIES